MCYNISAMSVNVVRRIFFGTLSVLSSYCSESLRVIQNETILRFLVLGI
jgi:hypothetical protein